MNKITIEEINKEEIISKVKDVREKISSYKWIRR